MFSGFRPVRAILTLLVLVVGAIAPYGGAQNAPLGIVVQPSDLTVTIATDRASYQIGENVRITGTVNQTAFLYVIDVDAGGQVTLIFPNRFSQNNQVPAGPYALPDKPGYNLTLGPPAGTEFEYAVASTEPLNLQAVFNATGFAPLGNPQQATGQIQGAIQALVPTAKVAVAFTSFQVLGNQQPPQQGTALLMIESTPSGAQIFLNSQARGTTPASFLLTAGAYQILLRASGCQDFLASLVLAPGEQRRLSAQLICTGGQLPPGQNPLGQIVAQGQVILPSDPRFAALAARFYSSLGTNPQGLTQRLQAAPGTAPQGIIPTPNQGVQFNIFPEVQNVDLNLAVLQQGQTLLLGTITLPTNGTIGGTPLPAGTYGVAVMSAAASGFMTDSSEAQFGGFVIVIIDFNTGNIVAFIFFPTISFFPFFFPVFSPIFVFQIIIQFTFVSFFPFPFPFPFPFTGLTCPALPFVTPFSVMIGAPFDTLLATPAFAITEMGFSGSGGALVRIQSLGPALSIQAAGTFSSNFVTVFPGGNFTFNVVSSSFVMRVDGGGSTGCVQATRSGVFLSGQASHN